jgi:hypothetical protein
MKPLLIIPLTFLLSFGAIGQEYLEKKSVSIGLYGIAYPSKHYLITYNTGILMDIPFSKFKNLYNSSSLNYTLTTYQGSIKYHELSKFSASSGFSWRLQNKRFCTQPGVQLGYLYIGSKDKQANVFNYILNGAYLRASIELAYSFKHFEIGMLFNSGIGIGPTIYYKEGSLEIPGKSYIKIGFLNSFGIHLKYFF